MPPPQEGKKAIAASGGDIIGTLQDELLQHVLSFLPAQQAVRTCVLARRWRDLWKTATGLRIAGGHESDLTPVHELREFVNHLLLLRARAPIDTCEFSFDVIADDDVPRVGLWIRHVILCQVRLLRLHMSRESHHLGVHFYVDNLPLVSRNLRILELIDTGLNDSFLDFAACPALEDLAIYNGCFVHVRKISSKSLKRLTITDCNFNQHTRTRIHVPSLISLRLEDNWDRTPVLESMPLLMAAFVRFIKVSVDRCFYSDSWDCQIEDCQGCYDLQGVNSDESVILKGLSEAENLILIDEHDTGPKHEVEIKGSYNAVESSAAISEHLKTVEVKCNSVDAEVLKILKFLGTLNICFEEEKTLAEDR